MALPRYNPSEVRLQPGAEAIAHQQVSNEYQNLSTMLNQWSGIAAKELGQRREREAKEQAVIDVAKGNIQDVGDFTIYDQVYKDTARSSYMSKTEQDAKGYAGFLKTQLDLKPETQDNPEAYAQAWDSYTKQLLKEAPDEATRAALSQSINKYGVSQINAIETAKAKKIEEYNKSAYADGIKLYTQEYKDAVLSKDVEQINIATQKLVGMYQNGVNSLYTNENAVKSELKQLQKDTFTEVSMQEFKETPNKLEYLDKFRDNKKLNSEETQKALDSMHKAMQSEYDDEKLLRELEEEEEEKFKDTAKNTLNKKLLNQELTKEDLDDAIKNNAIDAKEYDDYSDRMKTPGFTKDDDEQYQFYLKNIDTTSVEDVMNAPLTRTTKDKLIKMINDEEDALAQWQKSSNGKQAVLEIKTHFKIFDGTILSKADINNQNMQDYALIRSMYYDTMEATSEEERSLTALTTARDLMKQYQDGEIPNTKPYLDKKEDELTAKKEAELKEKKQQEDVKGSNNFLNFLGKVVPSL